MLQRVERIRRIVADVLGVAPEALTGSSGPDTLLGWTSLAHVNLYLTLEAELGVAFTPEEILELTSIDAIERIVGRKAGSVAGRLSGLR